MRLPGESERPAREQTRRQELPAFEELFHQHWERICRLLLHLTGDPAEAEDLALEAFWRLWQRPPARDDNLGGWLYRVASNLGYNALRARQRRRHYEERAGRAALETPDPAVQDDIEAVQEQVRQTLQNMPLRQAQLLVLRSNGLSYQEIAAALLVKPSSVGSLLARAEQKFERLYERSSPPHAPKR